MSDYQKTGDLQRNFETDVLIPSMQALITGVLLGVAAFVVAILAAWEPPWAYGVGAWAVGTLIAWLMFVKRSWRLIEKFFGVDLDNDGHIGEPPNPRIIVMDETDLGRTEGWILDDLPGGEGKFARLSSGVLNGEPLAERYWTGSKGPYTLSEFRDLRDYLLLRGLWSWQSDADHRQGVALAPPGRAMMRKYASMLESPYPMNLRDGRD